MPLEKYKFENIYQHDYFGMTSAFREELLGDKKYICSVFDLKNDKEALSDIGVFIASNNVNCKFLLLKVNDDGEIVGYSNFLYEENFEFPGYYVVSLPKKILLSDKKFGIGVKMTGPDLFIPCEKKEYNFCSKAVAQPNQNFYGNEYGFESFNAYDITNFCIKGFTEKNLDSAQNISYKKFLSRPIQCYHLGRYYQVALVFPVFIIHHNDKLSFLKVCHSIFYSAQFRYFHCSLLVFYRERELYFITLL